MTITMEHGAGGKATSALIEKLFAPYFKNPVLDKMEDAGVVPGASRLAVTTDSFVVNPLCFPGGDIGKLSVCGTVNDLLMSGATPRYLTCGFILEQGLETALLEKICASMAATAMEAGVSIVAGDTKVVEGSGGLFINTTGVGFIPENRAMGASLCEPGDVLIVSGNLGEHHAAILSSRMGIENHIISDCAPLNEMVEAMLENEIQIKALRDITRGGLATILNEFAKASDCTMSIKENLLPVSKEVKGFCGILGLDPLYMGNEGKLLAVVAEKDAERALRLIQNSSYGKDAAFIGAVKPQGEAPVVMQTAIGGSRIIPELYGEGLPRIC